MTGPRILAVRCFALAAQLRADDIDPTVGARTLEAIATDVSALQGHLQHILELLIERQPTRARHALTALLNQIEPEEPS